VPEGPPAAFVELVRDALLHLNDAARLQTHPLTAALPDEGRGAGGRGRGLWRLLHEAVEAFHPGDDVAATSAARRAYRILELRYVEVRGVDELPGRVALSRRQYYREHTRALAAVASLLWERLGLAGRWSPVGLAAPAPHELARREAQTLVAAANPAASRLSVGEVVAAVVDMLRPLFAQRGVALDLAVEQSLPPVRGERVALRQALTSLLAPASATASTVTVVAQSRPDGVIVELSGRAVRPLDATALGVDESRPFVEALGGRIAFEAVDGASWRVAIALPVETRPTLLVVDNNPDFVRLVERYMADQGWVVLGAGDFESAYALALERRPSAVLLDVVMPGRDGWELLRALKESPTARDIPVIICSVLHDAAVAFALGAAAYVQKPVEQADLIAALRAFA
jgi:CheY-like chemotaxis protein